MLGGQAREALKELRDLSRGIHAAILTEGVWVERCRR